ncbi:MAG: carboxypeptidase regulatory-like domain-containing protein [Holophagaceae bacterium]|nr:carboxypeptidase regulatory-like domain-containing protein [Holophagaceae bacterium]
MGKATVTVHENQVTDLEITCQDKGLINVLATQEGTPVQRATVKLQYRGGPALGFSAEATTDALGQTSFQVPPGNYDLEATDPVSHAVGRQSFSRGTNQGPVQVNVAISPVRDLALNVIAPMGWTGPLGAWKARTDTGRTVNLDGNGHALLQEMAVGAHQVDLSDANGRFRGGRVYQVKSDGGATQAADMQALARGGAEITVLDAHELPMPRIYVTLQSLSGDPGFAPLPTDINGKTSFQDFLEGDHGVDARSEDYLKRANGSLRITLEGETVPLTLHLGPTARFQGILTNGAGQPLPFLRVDYWKLNGSYYGGGSLATDGTGHFASGDLPFATYVLRASLDGQNRSGSRQVLLDQMDITMNADFSLNPAGRFTGRVIDPLRPTIPVVDVRILTGNDIPIGHTTVDGEGRFSFPNLPAQQDLKVQVFMDDGGTLAYSGTVNIPSEGTAVDQMITLQSLPDLRGRTRTADGSAHRSMTVQLYTTVAPIKLLRQGATSGDHPTFQFNYLQPGVDYELRGYEDTHLAARAFVRLVDSPEIQETELRALAQRDLGISLKYSDGTPLAASGHAVLTSDLNGSDRFEANLAADGIVHFTGLAVGPYHVSISGVPNQPLLTNAFTLVEGSGEQSVAVTVHGIGTLRVSVQTSAGRRLHGTSLTAQASGSPVWSGALQADGTYLVEGVWSGEYLTLQATGFGVLNFPPTLQGPANGTTSDVIWTAPDQGVVHGVVKDFHNQPLGGAVVALQHLPYGVLSTSTDATGAYALVGVPVGSWALKATMPGQVIWAEQSAVLALDQDDKTLDFSLPGTGTVNVHTLDRSGNPLGNQALSLSTLGYGDATRNATSDAGGNASFSGVMAGAVSANAMLENRIVSVSGTLVADASLGLDLKAKDATTVQGRIQRADPAKSWPAGTKAIVKGVEVPMAADGILQPVGGVLDFEYSGQAIPVDLQVPGASKLHMADLPMVKNGITQVDLNAPPLGTMNATVTKKDGSPAAGAKLTATGLPAATADISGKATLIAFAGSYTVYAVLDTSAGHANTTVTNDGEILSLPISLGEVLDVSGLYSTPLAPTADMLLFQDGSEISGEWNAESSGWGKRFQLKGTLDGTHVKLTFYTPDNPAGEGWMDIIFAPDGLSYTGTHSYYGANWNGTRKPGVFIKVSPRRATLAVNAILPLKALVAGSPDKGVIWTTSAGVVSAEGSYTAPATPVFAEVTATSVADPAQKALARVAVTGDGKLDVSGAFGPSGSDFLIHQEGDSVSIKGVGLRQFIGTLTGLTLSGSWTESNNAPGGRFEFVFEEDGGAFMGTYGIGTSSVGIAAAAQRQLGVVGIFTWPRSSRIRIGAAGTLHAYVVGTANTAMEWSMVAGPGSITAAGVFTTPNTGGTATVRVVSVADPAKADTAQIEFVQPIVITPGNATVAVGMTQNFTAQMTGFTNNSISWSANGGSIDSAGLYTAPLAPGLYTVTATSVEEPALKETATVTVRPFVVVTPGSVNLYIGTSKTFSASLTGLSGGVTWSCSAGSIDAYGTYTAPTTAGVYTVTATSAADPTKSGTATVDVTSRGLGNLRVSVQTDAGRRLQGTSITAHANGSPTWSGVLQGDGTYLIEGVWSGENIVLQATGFGALGYPPSVQGPANGTTVDVIWTAPNQGIVHGIVKDYRNQPLSGAVVALLGPPLSTTTDASGAYALVGVPVGYWAVKVTVPSQVIWSTQTVTLAQDQDDKTLDFTLPGTGTVVIHALDRAGTTPLVAQSITLSTQGNGDGTRTLATDAQGLARFEGVMAGTVSAYAVLEGRSVSVSGNLTAEAVLDLDLKALDATLVKGRIARAVTANTWPTGTKARIQGVDVPMASDGTLQPVGGRLDFLYSTTPISVDVLVPGAVTKHLGDLPMVKNGDTVVDLSAPALGILDLTITKQDGSAAAGASIGGPGLIAAIADATGKAQLLAWVGTVTVSGVLGSQFNHLDATITADAAVVPMAMQLTEGLDVSGVFRVYDSSYGWGDWVLFQDGNRITGTFNGASYSRVIEATLDGNVVDGTWADTASPTINHGRLRISFAADLASFTGTYGNGASYTGYSLTGTRQAGQIRVMVVPTAATLAVNGAKAFKALVAGTSIKTVTWTATGGTVDSSGLFAAQANPGFANVIASSTEAQYQTGEARVRITPDGQMDLSGVFGYWSHGTWGNWIDDWILHQSGNTVTGHWNSRNAHISGTLNGRVVTGTWKDLSGTNDGRIELTLDEDGGLLTGVWGYGANSLGNSVYGTRTPGRIGLFARPAYQKVRTGSATTLSAYVVGTQNTAVNWTSFPGTITPEGVYTAPSNPALCNLSVQSQADPSKTYLFTLEAVPPVVVSPATATLPVGGAQAFTATLTGITDPAVTWTSSGGTITAEGLLTAPTAPGTVTVTATSVGEPSLNGTATVSVRPFVEVSPTTAVLSINGTQQFTYQVTGLGNYVTWTCTAGSISAYGLYTAPAIAGIYTVTATSYYDHSKSASATVDVRSMNVRITPASASLYTNETATFTAIVDGLSSQAVTWSVEGGGSIDANGIFTAPATAGTSVVKATSDQDHSVFSTAQVEVLGINILTVELHTSDDRPVVNRPFRITWDGTSTLSGQTDATGKFTLQRLPLGKVLTLKDLGPTLPSGQQADPFWYPLLQDRSLTFTQSGESQGLSLVLPVGKLNLQFRRGTDGIPNVRINALTLSGKNYPWMNYENAGADANGNWTLLDVPLNLNLALIAQRAYITRSQTLLLDQPEKTIIVEWPALAGKQTVRVLRANGAPVANPEAMDFQAYPGNEDGSSIPDEGTGDVRSWIRMIPGFEQTATVRLDIQTPFNQDCGEISGPLAVFLRIQAKFTPGTVPETHDLRLPVLAGLRLRFQDKDGNPLPASLPGDHIVLLLGEGCPATYTVPDLDNCLMPEMFLEGPQIIHLRSELWGDLPDIAFTVAPADDGKTLEQVVKLPWVKTNFELKVLAGDHETPVPGASITVTQAAHSLELARVPDGIKDTDTVKASFLGPEATDLKLEASFTPRRQTVAVTDHLANQSTGGTLTATLTLPTTVVRTHLMETDGTELEGQGLDAKAPSDKGDADPEPTGSVQGKIYGLALGEAAGTVLDLRMYDPASGLGILNSATVPALGTHLDVPAKLAPHAWLTSAILTSAPAAPYLLVALGRETPELVKPEAASWLQGPAGIGSLKVPVFMSANSIGTDLNWIRFTSEVPDPANPAQPYVAWKPKVRIPLSGSIWAAAWTLVADDLGDGTFQVWPQLDPFGKGSINASENQELTASADPLTWIWNNASSLQVVDTASQPIPGAALQVWPLTAPGSWRMDTDWASSDPQGLWILDLPVDQPVHAQTVLPSGSCGVGTWLFGSLDFTQTNPPPATPPVLHATEARDLPPLRTSGTHHQSREGKEIRCGEVSIAPQESRSPMMSVMSVMSRHHCQAVQPSVPRWIGINTVGGPYAGPDLLRVFHTVATNPLHSAVSAQATIRVAP